MIIIASGTVNLFAMFQTTRQGRQWCFRARHCRNHHHHHQQQHHQHRYRAAEGIKGKRRLDDNNFHDGQTQTTEKQRADANAICDMRSSLLHVMTLVLYCLSPYPRCLVRPWSSLRSKVGVLYVSCLSVIWPRGFLMDHRLVAIFAHFILPYTTILWYRIILITLFLLFICWGRHVAASAKKVNLNRTKKNLKSVGSSWRHLKKLIVGIKNSDVNNICLTTNTVLYLGIFMSFLRAWGETSINTDFFSRNTYKLTYSHTIFFLFRVLYAGPAFFSQYLQRSYHSQWFSFYSWGIFERELPHKMRKQK